MSTNEQTEMTVTPASAIAGRFRGFLPVIVDVETGGSNGRTEALFGAPA